MQKSRIGLAAILDLESIGVDSFLGKSPNVGEQRVFGGLIIGQAIFAACRTVEARLPNSLHCYFLHTGDPQVPLIYTVERLRDGKSYSTRRVTATQHGSAIFSIMLSFHKGEEGAFEHQDKMPAVLAPEHFAAEKLSKLPLYADLPEIVRCYYEPDRPVELRPVEIGRYVGQRIENGRLHMWMKAAKKLPDDPVLHICALAYASDLSLLDAVMTRYGRTLFDGHILSGSLDHAMWFHRPFRADDWLLYAKDSPSAQSGRGLARGLIFKRDGTLVASVAQEGSVRERR
ncbi:acyl-CoA thioesterase [Bradyrhizobium sp. USDA 223]|uniref:acyl-CoA thioesterase n=1 Tax=Bradyrhizobium sp. USDA 223 TaxID=3156306 RepID=UPI0038365B2B